MIPVKLDMVSSPLAIVTSFLDFSFEIEGKSPVNEAVVLDRPGISEAGSKLKINLTGNTAPSSSFLPCHKSCIFFNGKF